MSSHCQRVDVEPEAGPTRSTDFHDEIERQIAVLGDPDFEYDYKAQSYARRRLVEIGEAAIDPLSEAHRNGAIEASKLYGILAETGPRGVELTLEAAGGDTDAPGPAIFALATRMPPPWEVVEIAIAGLGSRHSELRRVCVLALSKLAYGVEVSYGPASLERLAAALSGLLDCLEEGDDVIRANVAKCLGLLRLDPERAIPRLVAAYRESLRKSRGFSSFQSDACKAFVLYGEPAAVAIPLILETLAATGQRQYGTYVFYIRGNREEAIADLKAFRDQYRGRDRTSVRKTFNKTIQLIRAESPLRRRPRESPLRGDPYLTGLVERLIHDGDPWMWSSEERIRAKADLEAVHLNDPVLIPKLADLLNQKLDQERFVAVVRLLGYVTGNADSEEGRQLVRKLFRRRALSPRQHDGLVRAAIRGRVDGVTPAVVRWFRAGQLYFGWTTAIDFFMAFPSDQGAKVVADYLLDHPDASYLLAESLLDMRRKSCLPQMRAILESSAFGHLKTAHVVARRVALRLFRELGDKKAVPYVVRELEKLKWATWDECLVCLEALADTSALTSARSVILAAMKKISDRLRRRSEREEDGLAYVTSGLKLLVRARSDRDPEVVKLVASLRRPKAWEKLLPEEQAFIEERFSDDKAVGDDKAYGEDKGDELSQKEEDPLAARSRDWARQFEALVDIAPDLSSFPFQEELMDGFVPLRLSFGAPVVWPAEDGGELRVAAGQVRARFQMRFDNLYREPDVVMDEEDIDDEDVGTDLLVFYLRLADSRTRNWEVCLYELASLFLLADDSRFESHYYVDSPPAWQEAFDNCPLLFGAISLEDSRSSTVYEVDGDEIDVLYKYQGPCYDFALLKKPGPPRLLVRIFGLREYDTAEEIPAIVTAVGMDWLFSGPDRHRRPLKRTLRRTRGKAKAQKGVVNC